jgi:hypothetical protein
MTVQSPRVSISTPTEPILSGRGFYQLEEEALFVQIGPFHDRRKFYSYLDSNNISFQLDKTGRLIFVAVNIPRRRWKPVASLTPPKIVEPADIRWLDFREKIDEPRLLTNKRKSIVKLEFAGSPNLLNYFIAGSIVVQVDPEGQLCALWVTEIVDDLAGREIGAFRKHLRLNGSYYA